MQQSTYRMFKNLDGFVTLSEEQLKNYQKVIARITADIMELCDEYGIHAMLAYGSTLGAIRHSGFIPWDDDMDLFMFREDYEKFLPLFQKKYEEKYWIHTPEHTHNYGALLPKILLKGTVVRQFEDQKNDECGAFVDIFILENEFDNKILAKVHAVGCYILAGVVSCRRLYRDKEFMLSIIKEEKVIMAIKQKAFLGKLVSFIPLDCLIRFTYNWYKLCKDNHSRKIIIPCTPMKIGGDFYDRNWFSGVRKHLFENYEWGIPAEAEAYLARMYGDYMKIPPENKREKHTLLEFKI